MFDSLRTLLRSSIHPGIWGAWWWTNQDNSGWSWSTTRPETTVHGSSKRMVRGLLDLWHWVLYWRWKCLCQGSWKRPCGALFLCWRNLCSSVPVWGQWTGNTWGHESFGSKGWIFHQLPCTILNCLVRASSLFFMMNFMYQLALVATEIHCMISKRLMTQRNQFRLDYGSWCCCYARTSAEDWMFMHGWPWLITFGRLELFQLHSSRFRVTIWYVGCIHCGVATAIWIAVSISTWYILHMNRDFVSMKRIKWYIFLSAMVNHLRWKLQNWTYIALISFQLSIVLLWCLLCKASFFLFC